MKDLFKDLSENAFCKKSGVCSVNPVINALDAIILNEIRQISFYVIKLKELGYINNGLMKETVFNLSVNISDTSFNKKDFLNFYTGIRNTKEKIKDFYTKKCLEKNISYEIVTFGFEEKTENISDLIKSGEKILKHFYSHLSDEKIRLINIILLSAKTASIDLYKLSKYDVFFYEYYFEVLRLISITNNIGTRSEKYIRRIKEFSKIKYEIKENYLNILEKTYGKVQNSYLETTIYEGKSIFVSGGDLFELYNLLNKIKDEKINVYTDITMFEGYIYPEFIKFKNLKGAFDSNDTESVFSNFKGPVYLTRNSNLNLDMALRGNIYTTKLIPYDKAIKINENTVDILINAALKSEGENKYTEGRKIPLEFNTIKTDEKIKNSKGKILVVFGEIDEKIKEKFNSYTIAEFTLPNESRNLHRITKNFNTKNISVLFSKCSINSLDNLISILDKGYNEIYLSSCLALIINPHITESLQKDFNVKLI